MRRGQAAVEYLVTYGWAILALVIIVGVVVSSGVLSMDSVISDECDFGNNMPCRFALYNEGASTDMIISFYNSYPYKVRIDDIRIKTQDGTKSFTWADFPGTPKLREVESGANITISGKLDGDALPESGVKRFYGNLTYVSCAPELNATGCGGYSHQISGRVTGRIIKQ